MKKSLATFWFYSNIKMSSDVIKIYKKMFLLCFYIDLVQYFSLISNIKLWFIGLKKKKKKIVSLVDEQSTHLSGIKTMRFQIFCWYDDKVSGCCFVGIYLMSFWLHILRWPELKYHILVWNMLKALFNLKVHICLVEG